MLTTISLFFICSGFVIALIIANDLVQNKQSMKIMNVVWVLTALWASYLALWAYFKFGMETAQKEDGKDMTMGADMKMNMSMKDMPMDIMEELPILAFGEREDPRDCLLYTSPSPRDS